MEKYISPYTDFGFKKLFGSEENKEFMISLLNALLEDDLDVPIVSITYENIENQGDTIAGHKAFFDISCTDKNGRIFLVEMQNSVQTNFFDRSLFYATFPIRDQKKGEDIVLKPLYSIGFLNFTLIDDEDYFHWGVIKDKKSNKQIYDKLNFILIELPKFNRVVSECKNQKDKWIFSFKNVSMLDECPPELDNQIFPKFFEASVIISMSAEEQKLYHRNQKAYEDIVRSQKTSKAEGLKEGIEIGREQDIEIGKEQGKQEGITAEKIRMAKHLKSLNVDINTIAQASGLTKEEIEKL